MLVMLVGVKDLQKDRTNDFERITDGVREQASHRGARNLRNSRSASVRLPVGWSGQFNQNFRFCRKIADLFGHLLDNLPGHLVAHLFWHLEHKNDHALQYVIMKILRYNDGLIFVPRSTNKNGYFCVIIMWRKDLQMRPCYRYDKPKTTQGYRVRQVSLMDAR